MNSDTDIEQVGVEQLRDLYLDLLIGSLTHTIYRGIDTIEVPEELRARLIPAMLESPDFGFLFDPESTRAQGRDWPLHAQTMVGLKRLGNVRRCVKAIVEENVPGDLVEAGVWRGGVGILMRGVLKAHGVNDRMVWLADSFRGFPSADTDRERGLETEELDVLAAPVEEVRANFERYGLLDDQVRFVEGWFHETLPALRDTRWSLVRIDADLYRSTMDALVNLYDSLSPGGFLIIDDFALEPCREAVDDFRRDRGISEPIERIDWTGVFWRKRH